MRPKTPYLIRMFYQWILDSALTPILVISGQHPQVELPPSCRGEEEVALTIAPDAVLDLKLGDHWIEFKASFDHVVHQVRAPVKAIVGIFPEAHEEEGCFFDIDLSPVSFSAISSEFTDSSPRSPEPEKPKGKPHLRLVE